MVFVDIDVFDQVFQRGKHRFVFAVGHDVNVDGGVLHNVGERADFFIVHKTFEPRISTINQVFSGSFTASSRATDTYSFCKSSASFLVSTPLNFTYAQSFCTREDSTVIS